MRFRILMLALVATPTAHATTEMVADLRTDGSSSPQSMTVVDDTLYWLANGDDGVFGLWRLDAGSPTLVKNFREIDLFFGANRLTVFDGDFYFRGTQSSFPATGNELFRYDPGTDAVELVWNLDGTSASSNPQYLTAFDGRLYFVANVNGTGIELRSSDGTNHQTHDLWPGVGSAAPSGLTVFDGALWFEAGSPVTGNRHPCRFRDGAAQYFTGFEAAHNFEVWNGELYAVMKDDPSGYPELFKYDGTTFVQVADIDPTDTAIRPLGELMARPEGIYFAGDDGMSGLELWFYDGTAASRVADAIPGADGLRPADLAGTAGGVVFTALDATDPELYVYDGSAVILLRDINDLMSSEPSNATWSKPSAVIDGVYYFSADDGEHGRELWMTDGRSDATPVQDDAVDGVPSVGPLVWTAPTPNPTGATTAFRVRSGVARRIRVEAFDVTGRHVARLFDGAVAPDAPRSIDWDLGPVAPGTYFVRLTGSGLVPTTSRVVRLP